MHRLRRASVVLARPRRAVAAERRTTEKRGSRWQRQHPAGDQSRSGPGDRPVPRVPCVSRARHARVVTHTGSFHGFRPSSRLSARTGSPRAVWSGSDVARSCSAGSCPPAGLCTLVCATPDPLGHPARGSLLSNGGRRLPGGAVNSYHAIARRWRSSRPARSIQAHSCPPVNARRIHAARCRVCCIAEASTASQPLRPPATLQYPALLSP